MEKPTVDYDDVISTNGIYRGKYGDKDIAVKVLQGTRHQREIEIMKPLRHSNIVLFIIHWEIQIPPTTCIGMELCKKDLKEVVSNNKDLTIDAKRTIVLQILMGIRYLHENNILHRDLKPHNILLSQDEKEVKLCDFGLSKRASSSQKSYTTTHTFTGTKNWWSPEACKGHKMYPESDVFSAGLTFYYIISNGEHPFGDEYAEIIERNLSTDPDCHHLNEVFSNPKMLKLCKDMLRNMLRSKHDERPTADQVMHHPFMWMNSEDFHEMQQLISWFTKDLNSSGCYDKIMSLELHSNFEDETIKTIINANALLDEIKAVNLKRKTVINMIQDCLRMGIFKHEKEMWEFFASEYPEIFTQLYRRVRQDLQDLPESCQADYSDLLNLVDENKKLIPAPHKIDRLTCEQTGSEILIKWNPVEHAVRYFIRTSIDGKESKIEVQEPQATIEVSSGNQYTFTVWPQNEQGMNGHEETSELFRPVSPLDIPIVIDDSTFIDSLNANTTGKETTLQDTLPVESENALQNIRTRVESSSIHVSWNKPKTLHVFVYKIRVLSPKGMLVAEAQSSDCNYQFTDFIPGDCYTFEIVGENRNGKVLTIGVTKEMVLAPPEKVKNVKILEKDRKLVVKWESAASSYKIKPFCNGAPLSESSNKIAEFTFSAESVKRYHFAIIPVDKQGQHGPATVTDPITLKPSAVSGLKAVFRERCIKVHWEADEIEQVTYLLKMEKDNEPVNKVPIAINGIEYEMNNPVPSSLYKFSVWKKNLSNITGDVFTVSCHSAPPAISNLHSDIKDGKPIIFWDAEKRYKIDGFTVRVTDKNGKIRLINKLEANKRFFEFELPSSGPSSKHSSRPSSRPSSTLSGRSGINVPTLAPNTEYEASVTSFYGKAVSEAVQTNFTTGPSNPKRKLKVIRETYLSSGGGKLGKSRVGVTDVHQMSQDVSKKESVQSSDIRMVTDQKRHRETHRWSFPCCPTLRRNRIEMSEIEPDD